MLPATSVTGRPFDGSKTGTGAMPLIPAPIAKRRMPSALIASAAVFGGIFPALFSPSVSRTIARLFDFLSVNRFAAEAIAEPIAVPSSTSPIRTRSRFCSSQS